MWLGNCTTGFLKGFSATHGDCSLLRPRTSYHFFFYFLKSIASCDSIEENKALHQRKTKEVTKPAKNEGRQDA
jgi:hypothetical protein